MVPCGKCGTPVDIKFTGAPAVINMPNVSIVILEHLKDEICPGCLTKLVLGVQSVGGMVVMTIPLPEEKTIIVPPGGILAN